MEDAAIRSYWSVGHDAEERLVRLFLPEFDYALAGVIRIHHMLDLQRRTECNVFRTQFSKGILTVRKIQEVWCHKKRRQRSLKWFLS